MVALVLPSAGLARPCVGLPGGEARFLVVGRNQPSPGVDEQALEYAHGDAEAMADVAERHLCFESAEVTRLVGEDATVAAVRAHLQDWSREKLGRLFVYVASHGSPDGGVMLDAEMRWETLRTLVEEVGATQTFVFVDTCYSAGLAGNRRGRTILTPATSPGRFYLWANAAITHELHAFEGGEATRRLLRLLLGEGDLDGDGVITSFEVCRGLSPSGGMELCRHDIIGSRGIVLVPDQRPPGWLSIEEEELTDDLRWTYLLKPIYAGHTFPGYLPVRAVNTRNSRTREGDGLPPGEYLLERVTQTQAVCQRHRTRIESGAVTAVQASDWKGNRERCRHLRDSVQRVPGVPAQSFWVGAGLAGPWFEEAGFETRLRLGAAAHWPWLYRGGLAVQLAYLAPASIDPETHRVELVEVAGVVHADLLDLYLGPFDAFAGVEFAAAWTRARRPSNGSTRGSLTGWSAVRLGLVYKASLGWQPELVAQAGGRVFDGGGLTLAPQLGFLLGVAGAL